MSMNRPNVKKPSRQHSAYLSNPPSYNNLVRDDAIRYRRAQAGSEELRRAMMRYYFKRNGVSL